MSAARNRPKTKLVPVPSTTMTKISMDFIKPKVEGYREPRLPAYRQPAMPAKKADMTKAMTL